MSTKSKKAAKKLIKQLQNLEGFIRNADWDTVEIMLALKYESSDLAQLTETAEIIQSVLTD